MAVTKTLAHAGANTATWVISGDLVGGAESCLLQEDFEKLPTGRLRDVLTAEYTSEEPPSELAFNQKLTKFAKAWAAAGGGVSTCLATASFAPGAYPVSTAGFRLESYGSNKVAGNFNGSTFTGHLIIKISTNYSAGR